MRTNSPAPVFTLKAIASGRIFRLDQHLGRPVLLLFVDHNTGRKTREPVITIRQQYPDFTEVPIAIIVDLHVIPKLFQGTAERFMESAYHTAAAEVPSGFDPADHLVLLPDWRGQVPRAYGIGDVSKQICLVMVNSDGTIHDKYQGPKLAERALAFLKRG